MITRREITKQREKLKASMEAADDRLAHYMSEFADDDAEALEYFAHGMEGVMSLFQEVANDAGYLAELIDPNVRDKV